MTAIQVDPTHLGNSAARQLIMQTIITVPDPPRHGIVDASRKVLVILTVDPDYMQIAVSVRQLFVISLAIRNQRPVR